MVDLYLLALAAAPVSEARGAIIYGIGSGMNAVTVFLLAILINIAIIPFLFGFLKLAGFRKFVFRIYGERITRSIEKNRHLLEKYGELALLLFVAIPLPVTGAYTGVFVADTLGFNRRRAILFISLGVIIAATIVLLGASGIIKILGI